MDRQHDFTAPWGTLLKVMTGASIALLLGILLIGLYKGPQGNLLWNIVMIFLPPVMIVVAFFFSIRGYVLYQDTLFIKRIGWYSKLDLTELVDVTVDPEAMTRSIRTFGNGGMFCFAGYFKSKKIGRYRAWATDFKRAVVLRFSERTVIVTPGDPEGFVKTIKDLKDLR